MREAFSLLEFIVTLFILSIILVLGGNLNPQRPLTFATQSLIADLALTQSLALNDSRFFPNLASTALTKSLSPSINPHKLITHPEKNMWQIQFHTSGIYTQNSYSIYLDTPRHSHTTDYDGRPMSGDFIATESLNNQCLSGYNNSNVSDYCKNNTSPFVRLQEYFGVENMNLEGDSFCTEKGGWRIYFDDFGTPYCGKIPRKLTKLLKITLHKGKQSQSICLTPNTGYAFLCEN